MRAGTFEAKINGPCAADCGESVEIGDEVKWGHDGARERVLHAGCQMVPAAGAGEICTDCWEVKSVSGACFCELG